MLLPNLGILDTCPVAATIATVTAVLGLLRGWVTAEQKKLLIFTVPSVTEISFPKNWEIPSFPGPWGVAISLGALPVCTPVANSGFCITFGSSLRTLVEKNPRNSLLDWSCFGFYFPYPPLPPKPATISFSKSSAAVSCILGKVFTCMGEARRAMLPPPYPELELKWFIFQKPFFCIGLQFWVLECQLYWRIIYIHSNTPILNVHSMSFDKSIHPYNCHFHGDIEHFHHLKKFPYIADA